MIDGVITVTDACVQIHSAKPPEVFLLPSRSQVSCLGAPQHGQCVSTLPGQHFQAGLGGGVAGKQQPLTEWHHVLQ